MARLTVVHKTYLAFCAVLALLLVLVGFVYTSFTGLARANRENVHTHQVLLEAQGLNAATSRIQTAYRGYVLTGDERFQTLVLAGEREWLERLERLERLAQGNALHRHRLRQIRTTGTLWLRGHIHPGLAARRSLEGVAPTHIDLLAVAQPWRGQGYVDTIQLAIEKLEAIERQSLATWAYRVERMEQRTSRILGLGAAAAITFTALLATLAARRSHMLVSTNLRLSREVQERERAERDLQQLSRRYRSILNAAGDGIYGVDAQGVITFANPAAARLTGYGVDELIGKPHTLLHTPAPDPRVTSTPLAAALPDGSPVALDEAVARRRDGTTFPVEQLVAPILDGSTVVGAVVSFRDATGRRELDRIKDEFISVVSHELRTPLTSIHGSLSLLVSGAMERDPERARRMLEIAKQNSDRLVRLINDILDLERINAGRSQMLMSECDAGTLIEQAGEIVQGQAEREGIHLLLRPARVRLHADSDRLVQVLTNLLSNAIKFSARGGRVELTASARGGEVHFTVRDWGRGIPQQHLEEIFGRFQQVDASDAREKGGTGLGLAISRSIVEQHGGRIWVESVPGEGSSFTFVVPAAPHQSTTPPADPGPPLVVTSSTRSG